MGKAGGQWQEEDLPLNLPTCPFVLSQSLISSPLKFCSYLQSSFWSLMVPLSNAICSLLSEEFP